MTKEQLISRAMRELGKRNAGKPGSAARAAASRVNGAKGGRPKKLKHLQNRKGKL